MTIRFRQLAWGLAVALLTAAAHADEAVIRKNIAQRLPDYLEDETIPGGDAAWSKVPPANERNKKFGRHYTISSFRWLAADEI